MRTTSGSSVQGRRYGCGYRAVLDEAPRVLRQVSGCADINALVEDIWPVRFRMPTYVIRYSRAFRTSRQAGQGRIENHEPKRSALRCGIALWRRILQRELEIIAAGVRRRNGSAHPTTFCLPSALKRMGHSPVALTLHIGWGNGAVRPMRDGEHKKRFRMAPGAGTAVGCVPDSL